MAKTEYFQKVIDWAKRRGITGIKANYDGFDQPSVFAKVGEEKEFTPDVTGSKFDRKFYIEIATKSENGQRAISKWKLLSEIAKMKGGKLYLMTPRGQKAFVERILKKHSLDNTQLIYLPNI